MSTVASDFLGLVERLASRGPLPAVRRLHLPVETATRSKDAEFCALELDDGSIGLSYVLLGDTLARLRDGPGAVAGLDSAEVAGWYGANDTVRRTVGFAAVNALSQHLFARAGWVPDETTDSIGLLEAGPADHVGMVGLFPPLVEPLLGRGARLTVLELRAELAREEPRFRVTLDARALSACNKVLSTSTVLLNDTLDAILEVCRGAAYLAVIGPTAGCLPDPLFARGVSTVGGTRIVGSRGFLDALGRGDKWGGFTRKYCIRAENYPGFEALLRSSAARKDP